MASDRNMPSDTSTDAWIQLLRAHRAALGLVESRLRQGQMPSLEWYDVLYELERSGPLRPRDLQARLLVGQSNLSRLLDRMQQAGAVDRSSCADDARGQLVCATSAGTRLRKRMWPVYAAAIEDALGSKLTQRQAEALAALLSRLTADVVATG